MKLWYCPYCNDYADIGKKSIRHKIACIKKDVGMVELDADMAPIIRILNLHRYKTLFSCSGHVEGSYTTSYICFDKVYLDVKQAARIAGLHYEESIVFLDIDGSELYINNPNSFEIEDSWVKTDRKVCTVRCDEYIDDIDTYDLDSVRRHRTILDKYIKFIDLLSFKYYTEFLNLIRFLKFLWII